MIGRGVGGFGSGLHSFKTGWRVVDNVKSEIQREINSWCIGGGGGGKYSGDE